MPHRVDPRARNIHLAIHRRLRHGRDRTAPLIATNVFGSLGGVRRMPEILTEHPEIVLEVLSRPNREPIARTLARKWSLGSYQ